jgi:hypothetical protein
VIAGLEEKAAVITAVNGGDSTSASGSPSGGSNNPFLPGGNRGGRRF